MNLQSQFAATLVDEWVRAGVRHAVVSPGSRSSPLTIALLSDERIEVHVRLDERSGCFFALGCSLASGLPTLVVTTSGTAAAELHAGVAEADLAGVPLVICTADRPPELHGVAAAQTIDQTGLFGGAVRYAADLGVPNEGNRPFWRSHAARLVADSLTGGRGPGPVHANLPFREPLVAEVGELPAPAPSGRWHHVEGRGGVGEQALDAFLGALSSASSGAFVLGGGALEHSPNGLIALAERLGWPVLSDLRGLPREPFEPLIVHSDSVLRTPAALSLLQPDLVVHIGDPHLGRPMESWLAELVRREVPQLLVDLYGRHRDPARAPGYILDADPAALIEESLRALPPGEAPSQFLASWRRADDAAEEAIASVLAGSNAIEEPWVARRLIELAPHAATIVASASMPMRDLEWFGPRRHGAPRFIANRGANGIDGVTSTMLGVAAAEASVGGGAVLGLIGDLAFLHDLSGLVWGTYEQPPAMTIVLIDNAGGGIFNFLAYPGLLGHDVFERGFGTPQRADVASVAAALGVIVRVVSSRQELDDAVRAGVASGELNVVVCHSTREDNVELHEALNRAVADAISALVL